MVRGGSRAQWAIVAIVLSGAVLAAGCGSGSDGSSSASDVAKGAQRSVIGLNGRVGDDHLAGSAFVVDASRGLLVTNAHVVWGASELRGLLSDGTEVRGEIAAQAPCDDLAAIVLDPAPTDLQNAKLGDAQSVRPGDDVTAVGYTPGSGTGRKLVVTQGTVAVANFPSQIDHRLPQLPSLIEHQAPLTPSESGGPLVDRNGKVVAMNSVVGEADDAHAEPPFYAITTNRIKLRMSQLRRSPTGRYVGWNDAHRCHRPLERLARTLHHGYKMNEGAMSQHEGGGAMHGGEGAGHG